MSRIRFFRTVNELEAVAEKDFETLALFLTTDIGEDTVVCREIIEGCREVLSGKTTGWQLSGNGHSVDVELGTVHLESLFDERAASLNLPLPEFVQAVTAWLDFIENPNLLVCKPL